MTKQWKRGEFTPAMNAKHANPGATPCLILNGVLGVHRGLGPVPSKRGPWRVSHVRSGWAANGNLEFQSRDAAKRWAEALYDIDPVEWTKDMPNTARMGPKVREIKKSFLGAR